MQAKNMHLERIPLRALEEVIKMVRDVARKSARYGRHSGWMATAEEQRAVNEFLLQPAAEIVRQMKANGLSQVEKSPAQEAREAVEKAAS